MATNFAIMLMQKLVAKQHSTNKSWNVLICPKLCDTRQENTAAAIIFITIIFSPYKMERMEMERSATAWL